MPKMPHPRCSTRRICWMKRLQNALVQRGRPQSSDVVATAKNLAYSNGYVYLSTLFVFTTGKASLTVSYLLPCSLFLSSGSVSSVGSKSEIVSCFKVRLAGSGAFQGSFISAVVLPYLPRWPSPSIERASHQR